MTTHRPTSTTLARDGGTIAYDVAGDGPLVLLVPGMGDLRTTYRFTAPALRDAGYRVACTDLRGHGDSDATFSAYGDGESAEDIAALIETLGAPATIVGNSMGAAAAALTAARRPALVSGLVLIGPFVRNAEMSAATRVLLRVAMARPWAGRSWNAYLPKLYAGRRPEDFARHRDAIAASMRRPGHARAFSLTTRADHGIVTAALPEVQAPTLVVMGELDPDFRDPRAEAEWIAAALHGEAVMVPDAGHYPHAQQPQLTNDAIVRFLAHVHARA